MITDLDKGRIYKGGMAQVSVPVFPHCFSPEEVTDLVLNFYTEIGGTSIEFSGDTITLAGNIATVVFQPVQLDALADGLLRYNVSFSDMVFEYESKYYIKTPNPYTPIEIIDEEKVKEIVDEKIEEGGFTTSAETAEIVAEAMEAETARTEATYAKEEDVESAITEAMAAETARTEDTYAKPADIASALADYNPTSNFKTINNQSIIGEGNIDIQGGGGDSNYLIVDSLDEIENPVEGMKAYVRTQYADYEGVTITPSLPDGDHFAGWMRINEGEEMYSMYYTGEEGTRDWHWDWNNDGKWHSREWNGHIIHYQATDYVFNFYFIDDNEPYFEVEDSTTATTTFTVQTASPKEYTYVNGSGLVLSKYIIEDGSYQEELYNLLSKDLTAIDNLYVHFGNRYWKINNIQIRDYDQDMQFGAIWIDSYNEDSKTMLWHMNPAEGYNFEQYAGKRILAPDNPESFVTLAENGKDSGDWYNYDFNGPLNLDEYKGDSLVHTFDNNYKLKVNLYKDSYSFRLMFKVFNDNDEQIWQEDYYEWDEREIHYAENNIEFTIKPEHFNGAYKLYSSVEFIPEGELANTIVNEEIEFNDYGFIHIRKQPDLLGLYNSRRLIQYNEDDIKEIAQDLIDIETARTEATYSKIGSFSAFEKLNDYFYYTEYPYLDKAFADEYFQHRAPVVAGGCTSVRDGNKYGRNFDYYYSNLAEFLVKTKDTIGIAGGNPVLTKAFVESDKVSDLYRVMPFYLQDGYNFKTGLFANINMVNREESKGTTTYSAPAVGEREQVCSIALVRYIIDKFDSAHKAVEYIKNFVSIYNPQSIIEQGFELHWMIGDKDNTYVLEIVNGEVKYTEQNILSNFYVDGTTANTDGSFYSIKDNADHDPMLENGLTKYASGVERYNFVRAHLGDMDIEEIMAAIKYTHTYTDSEGQDFWYSEYVGGELGIDNTIAEYQENGRIDRIKAQYEERTRENPVTWHTMHSCVYDFEKKVLSVVSQEDTGNTFEFKFEAGMSRDEVEEIVTSALTQYNPTENFKTINGNSIIGQGNIEISGGSGDSNYLIVNSLDEIENPVEGMKAYVKAHTDYEYIEGITFDISNAIGGGESGNMYFGSVENLYLEFLEDNTVQTLDCLDFSRFVIEDDILYTNHNGFWFKKNGNNITAICTKEYDHTHYEGSGALEGATYVEATIGLPVNYPAKNYIYKNEWKSTDPIYVNKMTNEERAELVAEVAAAAEAGDDTTMKDIFNRIRVNEGAYEASKYSVPLTITYGNNRINIAFTHRIGQGEWGYNMFITIDENGFLNQNYGETTASQNNLGVVKIGSGINISDDGTISVEGGGGDSNYVIVDDISAVTNPYEGLVAYVRGTEKDYIYYEDYGWIQKNMVLELNTAIPPLVKSYLTTAPAEVIVGNGLVLNADGRGRIITAANPDEGQYFAYVDGKYFYKFDFHGSNGGIRSLGNEQLATTNDLNNYNPTANFKTINHQSIIGEGNIEIGGSTGGTTPEEVQGMIDEALTAYTPTTDFATVNGQEITEGGDITINEGFEIIPKSAITSTIGQQIYANPDKYLIYDKYYGYFFYLKKNPVNDRQIFVCHGIPNNDYGQYEIEWYELSSNGTFSLNAQNLYTKPKVDTLFNGKVNNVNGVAGIWSGTQAQYDAIATKDPNTLYIVKN